MNEQEAIKELKKHKETLNLWDCIPLKDLQSFDVAIKALEEIQQYRTIGTVEECREAVEKQKPKKVTLNLWSPALCPTCGVRLSESLGDGYYKHMDLLRRCTRCGQAIDWRK